MVDARQDKSRTLTDKDVVIVTGSSGYIGSAMVKALAAHYRVLGFDRESAPHPPSDAECICVDLTDIESLEAAFDRVADKCGGRSGWGHDLNGFGRSLLDLSESATW